MPHRRDRDEFDQIRELKQRLRSLDADPRDFVPKRFGVPPRREDHSASRPWFIVSVIATIAALVWEAK